MRYPNKGLFQFMGLFDIIYFRHQMIFLAILPMLALLLLRTPQGAIYYLLEPASPTRFQIKSEPTLTLPQKGDQEGE